MSSPKWTNEQQAVINSRDSNLLVSAAAGSGKTAVLVERIIQMITDKNKPINIDKLLVVTFTNAAASEMRERIGSAIGKALDANPENKHLQNQLVLLNKASITTIHSFCLEVIKSNFHKINLDPNFRIGDSTECTILKQEAIEEVFEELYKNQEQSFLNLVESYAEKKGDAKLQDIILSIYNFSTSSPDPKKWLKDSAEMFNIDEAFKFSDSVWAKAILNNIYIELVGLELEMRKALQELINEEELETYTEKFKHDYEIIRDVLEASNISWDQTYASIIKSKFSDYRKGMKKISKDAPNYVRELKEKSDDIRKKAKKIIDDMRANTFNKDKDNINEEIRYLYYVVSSISEVVIKFENEYSNKKREKGIIDFSDIEHFALEILVNKEDDSPSDVAISYRDKYYEIFIDEYQDSNLVQEVLLSTIAKIDNPNRFMVGDVKQSIYRFRQAKPEIFLQKYATYSIEEEAKYKKIMLYKNFRSRKEVIDSANYIFENIMSRSIGEIEYTEDERLNLGAIFKENTDENVIVGGPTEIHIMNNESSQNEENTEEKLSEDVEEEISTIQLEARMVGNIIKDMMKPDENGKTQMIFDKNTDNYRNIKYKDIVILLRATSSWAPVFTEELMNMDIPTYADIGIGYFDTIEIKIIVALLQIIDNPMQDIPLIAILNSPICGFTSEDLIDIRKLDEHKYFYEALVEATKQDNELGKKCTKVIEDLKRYKTKSLYMSTDEFLWYLYTDTGFYAYIGALPGGSQRQANLKVLFERAKQFESTSFKGIFSFINFINKLKKSNTDMGSAKTLGENADVVRIMTIHKSKGLEFPIVICSGMNKQFNKQDFKNDILYHHSLGYGPKIVDYERKISYPSIAREAVKSRLNIENLSEEMRVLYVAFTRPKEKLIITGTVKNIQKSINNWSNGVTINKPISEYKIIKGKTFLDWIMPAVLKHEDLAQIRENTELYGQEIHDSKWTYKIWNKNQITLNTEEKENQSSKNIIELLKLEDNQGEEYNQIKEKLDFRYLYNESTTKPSSISVTEIKKIHNQLEEGLSKEIFTRNINLKKPKFKDESKEIKFTGAEKGTIIHLAMEVIDFSKVKTIEEIKVQVSTLIDKNIITKQQATVINPYKIYKFFRTDIGKRILNSKFIKKEQVIYTQVKLKDIYINEDSEVQNEQYNEESIMLRGIIDLYFEEDDEIVIVDYKTDFINDENKDELIEKYKKQINMYSDAIEELTGKKVKDKCLYFFGLDDCIYV